MKRMFLVALAFLLVGLFEGAARAYDFDVDNVSVDGEQISLQTTYGGSLSLAKWVNVKPFVIKLYVAKQSASVRCVYETLQTRLRFLKEDDFYVFSEFIRNTGDNIEACSDIAGDDPCIIYIFF